MWFGRGATSNVISRVFAVMLSCCLAILTGCGGNPFATQISQEISASLGCSNFSENLTESLSKILLEDQDLPTPLELRSALAKHLVLNSETTPQKRDQLIDQLVELYAVITLNTAETLQIKNRSELLAALIALEIGDRSSPEKVNLQKKIGDLYQKTRALSQQLGASCATAPPSSDNNGQGISPTPVGPPPPAPSPLPQPAPAPSPYPSPDSPDYQKLHPVTMGGQRVILTAYQNCALQDIEAVNRQTPSVQGISITGTHANGVGLKRDIQNVNLVSSTHPYIREGVNSLNSCFQVPQNPLIYDYGGKPFARAAANSTLDLFKNAGSGTSALGIDCSGFVFSAMAVQGLRIARNTRLRADRVYGVSASMMMSPTKNGLTCLKEIDSNEPELIQDGDLLASSGHVVIIELQNLDPFQLHRIQKDRECTLANFHPRYFDFTILHSSPIKGGIGLNRTVAADYFAENSSMGQALAHYAVAACRKKFNQVYNFPSSMSARIVRHRLTPDCLDTPIEIERESCVRTCYERSPYLASILSLSKTP